MGIISLLIAVVQTLAGETKDLPVTQGIDSFLDKVVAFHWPLSIIASFICVVVVILTFVAVRSDPYRFRNIMYSIWSIRLTAIAYLTLTLIESNVLTKMAELWTQEGPVADPVRFWMMAILSIIFVMF